MFRTLFIDKLIELVREKQQSVDASVLHTLLQVQQVFRAFQQADEKVLQHLKHSTTIFNETKAMHQQRMQEAEERITKSQKSVVFRAFQTTVQSLLLLQKSAEFKPSKKQVSDLNKLLA